MASAREIKNRIRSVKNIAQIARALEAEAATKVRRAQARALASRAFAEKAWEILLNVQGATPAGTGTHPLLTERENIKSILIVVITSDRGLAGAYNGNILRVAQRFASRMGKPVKFIAVGKKARDSLIRARVNVIAEFSKLPANPTLADIRPIAHLAIDEFLSGSVDDVYIAYTDFINTITQRPVVQGWLPLIPHEIGDAVAAEYVKDVPAVTSGKQDYEYEPSPQAILDEIVPRFTELQLYQALLESQASEHSARMVAMRSASDNASQLSGDLTLLYNKARQSAITAEILDIVGGAEALQATIDAAVDHILAADSATSNGKSQKAYAKALPQSASKTMAATAAKQKAAASGQPDDLTKIEGIGPKMSAALKSAGISTFAVLAESSEAELRTAIEAAGMRFSPSLVTWARQATLAVNGEWDALEEFQKNLVSGREA